MKYAVIVSKQDQAGMNISKQLAPLIANNEDVELFIKARDSINCENIDKEIKADNFIFATRHASEQGKPCLSIHFPGNFSKAEFGGSDKMLCNTNASLLKELFLTLKSKHETATLEATHHGPYLEKPCLFIEIGSSEKEWVNEEFGKIIAETIAETTAKEIKSYKTCVAIGSGHYPIPFNKVLERTEYAIGHICPKYQLENLDEAMLKQMVDKSKPEFILLDWKGLGPYKEKVKALTESYEVKRIKELIGKA
tara:strand:+ start:2460 stop:3215 length:756 start_codon:yes stop_codon:yes gene_type:complete